MRRTIAAVVVIVLLGAPALAHARDEKLPVYKRTVAASLRTGFRSLTDIAESEPNNGPDQAQQVGCGNSLRPAALSNVAALPDTDWIRFDAQAGDLITFETAEDGFGFLTDTVIQLIATDGVTPLASNDDVAPGVFFSRIADFPAPYSGVYYGSIRGFNDTEGEYRANVSCVAPPPPPVNDQCDGAIMLSMGMIQQSGTTQFATDDYDLCPGMPVCPTSCTGFHSPGKDVVFEFQIAPEDVGALLNVTYDVSPQSIDASIYLVTDCSDVQGSCVAGADTDLGTPAETLVTTIDVPSTYYLILDGFTAGGGSWSLNGCLGCPTPVLPVSWGKLKIAYR